LSSDKLLILVRNALEKRKLTQENVSLKEKVQPQQRSELIGNTRVIKKIHKQIQRFAAMDVSVLIRGERGTGKAIVARMLHEHSGRATQSFVDINLAAIPSTSMESELFGHTMSKASRGSDPMGRLVQADKGSIFFNEVDLLSPTLQVRLLHVLKKKKIHLLRGDQSIASDIRLIAATSVDLQHAMQEQKVREDFYYHLSVAVIDLPALRHRKEDIPLLVEHFRCFYADTKSQNSIHFDDDVLETLVQHAWHGNIRELRNYIERCYIMLPGQQIGMDNMLPLIGTHQEDSNDFADSFHAAKESFERAYLLHNLTKHDWNISRTALHVGMERTQLYRKIKSFGLKENQS